MKHKKLMIFAGILLAGIILGCVFYFAFTIDTVVVEGTDRYTEEEIRDAIFQKEMDYHLAVFYFKSKFGEKKSIPFVEDYDVEIISADSVKITVYEKSLIGYVTYMGTNFYLDKDGYVVESSATVLEEVPYVTGLKFNYIVLQDKLPVADEDTFSVLLNMAQLLEKYSLDVDKIYIDEKLNLTAYLGNVKVELGNDNMLSEKISELKDISPNLVGYSGTLDMTVYKEDNSGYTLITDKYLGNTEAESEEGNGGDTEENNGGAGEDKQPTEEQTTQNEALNDIDDEVAVDFIDGAGSDENETENET
ncbi:MAG: cell division protein FtsQ [Lachnospiraceae bacterium]|nr:cell division protein FtsQ [Lachnospiraceae bacterium]